jgi:hypothetical protein
MSNLLISIHPETRDGTNAVFDLETKHFCKVQELWALSGGVMRYTAQSNT